MAVLSQKISNKLQMSAVNSLNGYYTDWTAWIFFPPSSSSTSGSEIPSRWSEFALWSGLNSLNISAAAQRHTGFITEPLSLLNCSLSHAEWGQPPRRPNLISGCFFGHYPKRVTTGKGSQRRLSCKLRALTWSSLFSTAVLKKKLLVSPFPFCHYKKPCFIPAVTFAVSTITHLIGAVHLSPLPSFCRAAVCTWEVTVW